MPKPKSEPKKEVLYWIDFSKLNGRDMSVFVADEMEVLENGFVRASGSYRRRKNHITILIPTTSISCIEVEEVGSGTTRENDESEAPADEKV